MHQTFFSLTTSKPFSSCMKIATCTTVRVLSCSEAGSVKVSIYLWTLQTHVGRCHSAQHELLQPLGHTALSSWSLQSGRERGVFKGQKVVIAAPCRSMVFWERSLVCAPQGTISVVSACCVSLHCLNVGCCPALSSSLCTP